MSIKAQYSAILLFFITWITGISHAQISGGNVFIKANYIELGIAPNGALGTTINAPMVYNARSMTNDSIYDPITSTYMPRPRALGFVADYGKDGWMFGSPGYYGDYLMPGAPQEGFSIQAAGRVSHAWSNLYHRTRGASGYMGGLTGANVSYSNSGFIKTAVWQGNTGSLSVRQTTSLIDSNLFFTVTVVLKNNGSTALNEVFYMRTMDPDNDWAVGNGSALGVTDNKIVNQLPNVNDKVLVCSRGTVHRNAYLGLGTKDCRARAFILRTSLLPGFGTKLADIYNNISSALITQSGGDTADHGMGLVFNLGNIAPGDSVSLSYAYILNESDLDEAVSQTMPGIMYNGTFYASGDTISLCQSSTAAVQIQNGDFYNWNWSPSIGLSNTTGATNAINVVGVNPRTYTILGTSRDINFCASSKSIKLTIKPIVTPQPVATDVTYCEGQNPSPLIATGTNLLWYTAATGGTGVSSITPSTAIAGVYQYYVTQTASGCESARTPLTVTVHDLLDFVEIPSDDTVCIGSAATFKIKAKGNNITYQWQANDGTGFIDIADGAVYTGTLTSQLNISNTTASLNNIRYRCIINGLCSTAPMISAEAKLNVLIRPQITTQPTPSIVCVGFDDTLSVVVNGIALTYQWQMGTSNGYIDLANNGTYSGVNSPSLIISRASHLEAGEYRCVVSNRCLLGDTSASVIVTVSTIANIWKQPTDNYICDGAPLTLEVLTSGDVVRYQWQQNTGSGGWKNIKNSLLFSGSNTNVLSLSAANSTIDSNQYRCIVYGKCITRYTTPVSIWLFKAPDLISQPQDVTTEYDKSVSFEVQAKGVGIKYRWQASSSGSSFVFINDNNMYSGTRTRKLTVKDVLPTQNSTYFRCLIEETGNCNYSNILSESARLSVVPPTAIYPIKQEVIFNVYPNPATGNDLYIQTDASIPTVDILISNSIGQVVVNETAHFNNGIFTTNITTLPSGIYIIRILSKDHIPLLTQTISIE